MRVKCQSFILLLGDLLLVKLANDKRVLLPVRLLEA